jgi:hypothetical protein
VANVLMALLIQRADLPPPLEVSRIVATTWKRSTRLAGEPRSTCLTSSNNPQKGLRAARDAADLNYWVYELHFWADRVRYLPEVHGSVSSGWLIRAGSSGLCLANR